MEMFETIEENNEKVNKLENQHTNLNQKLKEQNDQIQDLDAQLAILKKER